MTTVWTLQPAAWTVFTQSGNNRISVKTRETTEMERSEVDAMVMNTGTE